jgi:histidinol dehydrogenase
LIIADEMPMISSLPIYFRNEHGADSQSGFVTNNADLIAKVEIALQQVQQLPEWNCYCALENSFSCGVDTLYDCANE